MDKKTLIEWKEEYSVGIEEIDDQHQHMVGIINDLFYIINNKEFDKVDEIYERASQYAKYHFDTEEKYFEEFEYGDTEAHIAQHNKYNEKILEFSKQYNQNDTPMSFQVIDFLEDWWINHIQGVDKKYTECFHDHGLK